ncbi:histidinol-phosphate transaminase [Roseateles sp. P5_E11]
MPIQPPPHIRETFPYVAGRPIATVARETGIPEGEIVKLASNENPLGMSDLAKQAYLSASSALGRYPDADAHDLRAALSAHLDVPAEWIVMGSGSNEILDLAATAFLDSNAECVHSEYAFIVYRQATQRMGARHIVVPARELGHDLDAMLARIGAHTRLVFVANPNNPTGTFIEAAALQRFLAAVPSHVVVVLDEAYNEYLPAHLQYNAIDWLRRFDNLLVTRTFSKAYGLAGLRVGYGVGNPALVQWMQRVRPAFNVTTPAQAAAIAALRDKDFLRQTYETNTQGMRQLQDGLVALGVEWSPSVGNFLLARFDDAAQVNAALLSQGVIVRPLGGYELASHLRISVGTAQENQRLLTALSKALSAKGATHG